jgi:hypothetical protein
MINDKSARRRGTAATDNVRDLALIGVISTPVFYCLHAFAAFPLWPGAITGVLSAGMILWLAHRLGPAPSVYCDFPRRTYHVLLFLLVMGVFWNSLTPAWWYAVIALLLAAWLAMARPWRKGATDRPPGRRQFEDPCGGGGGD